MQTYGFREPQNLDGFFDKVTGWVAGGGNRPGTPETRKGAKPEDVDAEIMRLTGGRGLQQSGGIGGVPMEQVIMLGGFALAVLLLTKKGK